MFIQLTNGPYKQTLVARMRVVVSDILKCTLWTSIGFSSKHFQSLAKSLLMRVRDNHHHVMMLS